MPPSESQALVDGRFAVKFSLMHFYKLDGITHALDRQDVAALSVTGSGKLAYIHMLVVVLLALAKNPSMAPVKKKLPADPAAVVVCPTTTLEDDLVRVSLDI